MSGPPKTPSHLRLVRGNPSKRPINKDEPKPPKGVPPTPKHFDKQGKYWFKRMGEELDGSAFFQSWMERRLNCWLRPIPNIDSLRNLEREGATKASPLLP
jgi:hypothetical protein